MIRQREVLAKNRRRITLIAVLATLVLALSAEHSGLGHADSSHEGAADVVSMCLAVLGAGAVLLGAMRIARGRFAPSIPQGSRFASFHYPGAFAHTVQQARAGPQVLQVFRL